VSGLLEAVMAAGPGIGFLLGGTITALLSPRMAFAVAGGGVIAVVLVASAVFARRRALPSRPATPAPDAVV
jgi:hypothetical protein